MCDQQYVLSVLEEFDIRYTRLYPSLEYKGRFTLFMPVQPFTHGLKATKEKLERIGFTHVVINPVTCCVFFRAEGDE